ncbi:hypothetical protein BD769DRAFT_1392751 [Suillus cothurnatus]|nr:hypothetical protein BD769DRAFT_1392751 [Suillus cothurnatus]
MQYGSTTSFHNIMEPYNIVAALYVCRSRRGSHRNRTWALGCLDSLRPVSLLSNSPVGCTGPHHGSGTPAHVNPTILLFRKFGHEFRGIFLDHVLNEEVDMVIVPGSTTHSGCTVRESTPLPPEDWVAGKSAGPKVYNTAKQTRYMYSLTSCSAAIVIAINIDIYKLLMSGIIERLILCSSIFGLTHQLLLLT